MVQAGRQGLESGFLTLFRIAMNSIRLLACALALVSTLGCQAQPDPASAPAAVPAPVAPAGVAPDNSHALPKHALIGYLHNFDNGTGMLPLGQVDDSWDVIVLAFAEDKGEGRIAFTPDPALDRAQLIADIAAKRAQGKIMVRSFGGELGTVTLSTRRDEDNFVAITASQCDEVAPAQPYPTFRGVMTWSINRDVTDGRTFSVPVGTHLRAATAAN